MRASSMGGWIRPFGLALALSAGMLSVTAFVSGDDAPRAAFVAGDDAPRAPFFSADAAPAAGDDALRATTLNEKVLLGRHLVIEHACGDCHGGYANPAAPGWLAGVMSPLQEFKVGPFTTRPRNLTPDNETGLGRFSERQIFNALRYGLRPGETPDVEITSSVPGEGNFPLMPKYLAPPMPWPSFRHMSDDHLWAIAAYLKHGLKPVSNRVADSEGPPDFWVSTYTPEFLGAYPMGAFPGPNEVMPVASR